VPGGLSIAGFDDIFGSELTTPALTTVRMPLTEAGERAVEHLLARIAARGEPSTADAPDDSALLPTELVVRGSTGSPAA
jgi:LacI family transcriptional regulator